MPCLPARSRFGEGRHIPKSAFVRALPVRCSPVRRDVGGCFSSGHVTRRLRPQWVEGVTNHDINGVGLLFFDGLTPTKNGHGHVLNEGEGGRRKCLLKSLKI
jgi:hypothetical protein